MVAHTLLKSDIWLEDTPNYLPVQYGQIQRKDDSPEVEGQQLIGGACLGDSSPAAHQSGLAWTEECHCPRDESR